MASYAHSDRLLMGSPLRRRGVCLVTSAVLLVVLAFATLVHLGLIGGMRANVMAVFLQALVLSSLLAAVPLAVLWFLDRRERETPWLFAAAFLWGGCIATALALPFNTAFFLFVDAAESKGLKKGSRVYWRGDATDGGIITEMSWDAVTIAWDNGQVATVHHGDMREIQRAPAKPTIV